MDNQDSVFEFHWNWSKIIHSHRTSVSLFLSALGCGESFFAGERKRPIRFDGPRWMVFQVAWYSEFLDIQSFLIRFYILWLDIIAWPYGFNIAAGYWLIPFCQTGKNQPVRLLNRILNSIAESDRWRRLSGRKTEGRCGKSSPLWHLFSLWQRMFKVEKQSNAGNDDFS